MVTKKALSTNENLLNAIRENWNDFDKEYRSRLAKGISERLKT